MGSLYRRGSIWWIKYYANGRPYRESSGSEREKDAKDLLKSREGKIADGIPVTPKVGRVTFEEASKDLLNEYLTNRRKTYDDLERRIDKHLTPAFGKRRLGSIQTADVRTFIAERQREIRDDKGKVTKHAASNAEINRELAALKRMFTLAVQGGKLHHKPHIPMLQEDNVRRGFFEKEQFESVRKHLPADLRPVVTFAYLTGWRTKSEILPLQWRNVDWEARQVRLDAGTTKNREGRAFPFTTELEALLKAQKAVHDTLKDDNRIVPWVFHRDGERIKNFRGAWTAACKSAGVPGRILHDFRRTAVRNLERAGVPRSSAMAMVGHKTESIYRRYAIVDAGALREAAAKIDSGLKAG
jgi:integrase